MRLDNSWKQMILQLNKTSRARDEIIHVIVSGGPQSEISSFFFAIIIMMRFEEDINGIVSSTSNCFVGWIISIQHWVNFNCDLWTMWRENIARRRKISRVYGKSHNLSFTCTSSSISRTRRLILSSNCSMHKKILHWISESMWLFQRLAHRQQTQCSAKIWCLMI